MYSDSAPMIEPQPGGPGEQAVQQEAQPARPAPVRPVYAYTTPEVVYSSYHCKQSIVLGSVQICIGVFCIIINAIAISYRVIASEIGHGIWGGILFIITGSFGIAAAKSRSKCKIVTSMILCIISSSASLFLFIFSLIGTLENNYYYRSCAYWESQHTDDGMPNTYYRHCFTEHQIRVRTAMGVMLMVLAVLEAAIGIWGSVLGCKVACCCGAPAQVVIPAQYIEMEGNSQFVVFSPQPGGQMMASYSANPYPGHQNTEAANQLAGHNQMGNSQLQFRAEASGGSAMTPPPMYAAGPPPYAIEKIALP